VLVHIGKVPGVKGVLIGQHGVGVTGGRGGRKPGRLGYLERVFIASSFRLYARWYAGLRNGVQSCEGGVGQNAHNKRSLGPESRRACAAGPRPTSPREGALQRLPAELRWEGLRDKAPRTSVSAPSRGRARP
jgi:hypothetical protein